MGFNLATDHPAGWVTVTTAKHAGLFLSGDTLTFTLSNTNAVAYELRNYWGAVVSGVVSGTTLTLSALPLGWYKLYLYQSGSDVNYGAVIGYAMFSVIAVDGNLPSPPAAGTPFGGDLNFQGQDHILRGVTLSGPYRNQIEAAQAPTTTGYSISRTQDDRAYQRDWYEATPDAARPRPAFLQFPNGGYQSSAHTDGVTASVDALYPDIGYFEGPSNEPDLSNPSIVANMNTFATAVRAGNASAKVMGPNPVEITPAAIGRFDSFLAAGGAANLDALSFHGYNAVDGDIVLGRRTMDGLMRVLAANGHSDMELWQTEWGLFASTYGVFHPRRQCRWWAAHRFVMDQYGIPKERDYWFYDASHGFWEFPSFWKLEDSTVTPLIPMMRVYSREVHGKEWAARLDFGTVENNHYIGSRFEAEDGSSALTLLSTGRTDGSVTFRVDGAPTLTAVNCFGITSTITVTDGLATVDVALEPSYLRLPVGVTAVPEAVVFGANLLRGATGSAPGSGLVFKPLNGRLENGYAGVGGSEYRSTEAVPDTYTATLPRARWIDTIIAHCPTPWQSSSTLLDFDVEYQTEAGTWHLAATITEPTLTVTARADATQGACTIDTYHSGRCIFRADLTAPVHAAALRIAVRDTTNGGEPTAAANTAGGQGNAVKYLSLRELSAYCRAPLPRRRSFAAR